MLPFHRLPAMTSTVTTAQSSTFFMSDIMDAVQDVNRFKQFHPSYRGEPSIKCGDVKRLWHEIDKVTGREVKDEPDGRPVSSMQFSGVPVIEHPYVPANIVVVMMGDEVVNIIRLDNEVAV